MTPPMEISVNGSELVKFQDWEIRESLVEPVLCIECTADGMRTPAGSLRNPRVREGGLA